MSKGVLTITIIEGDLTHDTETFGKMDIYAKFNHSKAQEKKIVKTQVVEDAGKKPVWKDNNTFTFTVDNIYDEEIKLDILDEDVTSSDLVGSAALRFDDLILNGGVENWFEIYYDGGMFGKKKGLSGGRVKLRTKWEASAQEESKDHDYKPS